MSDRQPDRLTKLEATVESLAHSVETLAVSVEKQSHEIGQLARAQAQSGRPSLATILSVLGILLAAWAFAIKPIESNQSRHEQQIATLTSALTPIAALPGVLREIGTRVTLSAKLRQQQYDTLNRLIVPLWKKALDIDIPMPTYHPELDDSTSALHW